MRASDIKKANRYSRKKNRPNGCPPEILYLKTNKLECQDNTLMIIPEDTKKIGAYGIDVNVRGTWYLVKGFAPNNFIWISAKQVTNVEPWSNILQQELDKSSKEVAIKSTLQEPQNIQNELVFNKTEVKLMMVMLEINSNKRTLKAKLNGKLVEPRDGFKTVKDYLSNQVQVYGSEAVSYQYSFQ